jgi:hypothetical protein
MTGKRYTNRQVLERLDPDGEARRRKEANDQRVATRAWRKAKAAAAKRHRPDWNSLRVITPDYRVVLGRKPALSNAIRLRIVRMRDRAA